MDRLSSVSSVRLWLWSRMVPLGFGEPFFPWFGCRHEFIERINVRNTFIATRMSLTPTFATSIL